jgi:hypothetical protein
MKRKRITYIIWLLLLPWELSGLPEMIKCSNVFNGLVCRGCGDKWSIAVLSGKSYWKTVEQAGDARSAAVAAFIAGAWLTPQKKARSTLEVYDMNNTRGFGSMLITAEDLIRTLKANDRILVGDGAGFKALDRPWTSCLGVWWCWL